MDGPKPRKGHGFKKRYERKEPFIRDVRSVARGNSCRPSQASGEGLFV